MKESGALVLQWYMVLSRNTDCAMLNKERTLGLSYVIRLTFYYVYKRKQSKARTARVTLRNNKSRVENTTQGRSNLCTLSTPGAWKGLFRPCMHPAPVCASSPCSHMPITVACLSLGGPGSMHSFSDVSEKLLQARYTTQYVVCAKMWHLASIHGSPHGMLLTIGHMLSPPTDKANPITPTEGATWQLLSVRDYSGLNIFSIIV